MTPGAGGWTGVPTFGAAPPDRPPTVRPSAYACIPDAAGRVAVVRTPLGAFLPGGGMDPGESPEETVRREAREECALAVRVGAWRARAVEHTYSPQERTQFEKRSTFVDAAVVAPDPSGGEADHELCWLPLAEAAACLTPPSHRWALGQWALTRRAPERSAGTCGASS